MNESSPMGKFTPTIANLTHRQWLAAHAPREPAWWFKPNMPPRPESRMVKKPKAYADLKHSMANCLVPPIVVSQGETRTTVHPISCQCEACTLARLNSPQIRKK